MRTLTAGERIPEWSLPMTPTTIVSTAIATRDWQDVHHDRDIAQAAGSKDIFMNILTSNGLVERYVVDWAGHDTELKGIAIRLGAPAHPYDTLTFSGTVDSIVDGFTTFTMDTSSEIAVARELGCGELRFFSRINYGGGGACATVQQAAMAV